MSLCLGHPELGYYRTRDPLGQRGDFITAPEISQMFGELIGIWMASVWDQLGRPAKVRLVELGPGRGTLMADALRAAKALPDFVDAASVHLVETSPVLREAQKRSLAKSGVSLAWHADIADIPEGVPLVIVANEFFDALPIRQFVATAGGWRERMVGLSEDGALVFGLSPEGWPGDPEKRTPDGPIKGTPGDIREVSPEAQNIMTGLARQIAVNRGALLAIDYGYARSAPGDTLQAMAAHRFVDVLDAPGNADLTAHVDFEALARAAKAGGVLIHPLLTQSALLQRLGIVARTAALQRAAPARAGEFEAAALRLAGNGENQMGTLFKAFCVSSRDIVAPPAFDSADLSNSGLAR